MRYTIKRLCSLLLVAAMLCGAPFALSAEFDGTDYAAAQAMELLPENMRPEGECTEGELYGLMTRAVIRKTGDQPAWEAWLASGGNDAPVPRIFAARLLYECAMLMGYPMKAGEPGSADANAGLKIGNNDWASEGDCADWDQMGEYVAAHDGSYTQGSWKTARTDWLVGFCIRQEDLSTGKKILTLTEDTRFRPMENLTRAEAISAVVRLYRSFETADEVATKRIAIPLKITVDGERYEFTDRLATAKPYLRMQDIALAFSKSDRRFALAYQPKEKTLSLTMGKTYKALKAVIPSDASILLDKVNLTLPSLAIEQTGYFSLQDFAQALNVGYGYDAPSDQYFIWTSREYSAPGAEEIARAINTGIIPEDLIGDYDKTITHREDSALIRQMMTVFASEGSQVVDEWNAVAKEIDKSDLDMQRSDGMMAMFYAAEILGLSDSPDDYWDLNETMGPGVWSDLRPEYPLFPGWDQQVTDEDGKVLDRVAAAYFLSFTRYSLVSRNALFDYDVASNSMRVNQPFTRGEAILAALRLYESDPGHAPQRTLQRTPGAEDEKILSLAEEKKQTILNSKTDVKYKGKAYYVSNAGNDSNDGRTPETAWATLERVNGGIGTVVGAKELKKGDAVFFRRGDIFRGQLVAKTGVTYSAFGEGPKPGIYGSPENGADAEKWSLLDGTDNIWVFYQDIMDCGGIVLNDGETVAQKTCAYWDGEKYYEVLDKKLIDLFDVRKIENTMFFNEILYPKDDVLHYHQKGKLYFRCDEGNPGTVYSSIEFVCGNNAWNQGAASMMDGSVIDNLCFFYASSGICTWDAQNVLIQNCEIGWTGGIVLGFGSSQLGGDDAPQVVRTGDGIMLGGNKCTARNNYIHHIYDHAFTIESFAADKDPKNIKENEKIWYRKDISIEGNVTESCFGGLTITDWYANAMNIQAPIFRDITVNDNYFLYNGYNRPNPRDYNTGFGTITIGYPKGSGNIRLTGNVFYLTKKDVMGPLVSLFCHRDAELPVFSGNTYVQEYDQELVVRTDAQTWNFSDGYSRRIFLKQDNVYSALNAVIGETKAILIE